MILLEILGIIGVFSLVVYLVIFFGNLLFRGPKKKNEKKETNQEELIDPLELIKENRRLKGEVEREKNSKIELLKECRVLREYVQLLDDAFDKGDTDFIYHELKTRNLKNKRLPEIQAFGESYSSVSISGFHTYSTRY